MNPKPRALQRGPKKPEPRLFLEALSRLWLSGFRVYIGYKGFGFTILTGVGFGVLGLGFKGLGLKALGAVRTY